MWDFVRKVIKKEVLFRVWLSRKYNNRHNTIIDAEVKGGKIIFWNGYFHKFNYNLRDNKYLACLIDEELKNFKISKSGTRITWGNVDLKMDDLRWSR